MIAYFVTHDFKFIQAKVVKKPYVAFIEDTLNSHFFATSLIALSNGGKVTLDSFKTNPAYRHNGWFDFASGRNKSAILEFIEKNNGNLFNFQEYQGENYYKLKNESLCPLCGNIHKGNGSTRPQKLCENEVIDNPMLFDLHLNTEKVLI